MEKVGVGGPPGASPDELEWKKAMQKEIETLAKMNTWTIVTRERVLKKVD